jgi:hypothetical protein
MKRLSTLLTQRADLLRQARLANLALAYATLEKFATRIRQARLRGGVTLVPPRPEEEQYLATLTALAGAQSVIEEHFVDEDLLELADLLVFVTGRDEPEWTFPIEEMGERFLVPLRAELEREGIEIDRADAASDAVR